MSRVGPRPLIAGFDSRCGAGWYPARRLATGALRFCLQASKRVTNPLQVDNLPHKLKLRPAALLLLSTRLNTEIRRFVKLQRGRLAV
jgi:hypothetical protein